VRKCGIVTEDTSDAAVAEEAEDEPSVTELLEQLGRQVAALVYYESRLVAARNKQELRQAGVGVAAGLGVVAAFATAFVLANAAVLLALANAMDAWLAALLLAVAWAALATVLGLALWARVKRASQREGETVEEARERAEQDVRATLEQLGPVITKEIALAAVPSAGGIAEFGEDLVETVDDIVDDLADEIPGGGVVNQVWDVVMAPGRFGIRVATTVLKRD
jgi:membrane protein